MSNPLQTTDSIIFDGTVSGTTALGVGVLLAAIAAWLLWRERQTVGPKLAGLFWLLRMTALGMALWMLSGPMHETVKRETVTQSVAILTDASQSMDTVDPSDASSLLRWTLAAEAEAQPSAIGLCDNAQVAIRFAKFSSDKAAQLLREHRPISQLKQALDKTRIAADRAQLHCHKLIQLLNPGREDLAARVENVETLLQGPITASLNDLQESLEEDTNTRVTDLTDTLEVLGDTLTGASRRIDILTKDLAKQIIAEGSVTIDKTGELTRREKASQVLDALQEKVLGELADNVRIRKFQFDASLTPIFTESSWSDAAKLVTPAANEKQQPLTDLTAVLNRLATDHEAESTRLAILLTDGNHTAFSEQAPQEAATQIAGLPVFTVPIGNAQLVRDLRIHRVEAPATVVENDTALIEAIITAVDCDGLAAEVSLRHNGQEIDRQTVAFVGNRMDRRVQFSVPAQQIGRQDYELTVEPLEDEASVVNNVAPISWEVVRDKVRVLLADGISQWEFRYLQQLFRRDSHIECDELLFSPRLRGTGALAANPRLPEQIDDWAVYDVVILGDLDSKHFSTASQASLAEYVRKGHGHLILLAGRDHMPGDYRNMPLIDLLPVTASVLSDVDEGHSLMLTDEGRLHSALAIEDSPQASELAWVSIYRKKPIYVLSEYNRPKPTARTLLRAVPTSMPIVVNDQATRENLPAFLCWHQVGGGKVVFLGAPEIWKLRFRTKDRRHHRFWGQMIRWITAKNLGSGTDLIRLSTNKKRYQRKEPIEAIVWLKDQTGRPLPGQQLQLTVRTLEEDLASVELTSDPNVAGRYFGELESLPPGAYQIVVTGPALEELLAETEDKSPARTMITVETSENLELLDTRSDRTLLEQVAKITGGQVIPPTAIAEVLRLASFSPQVNETVKRTPLWNRWANLWIVLGCLVVEWVVRKQKGLV